MPSVSTALHLPAKEQAAEDVALEPNLVHRFAFAPQRWKTGVSRCLQAALMLGTGGFLVSEAPFTPKLATQIVIVGSLLGAGGLALVLYALSDLFGGVTIDRQGVRARFGLCGFFVSWNELQEWEVQRAAATAPERTSLRLWVAYRAAPYKVPGVHLRETDLDRMEQLLEKLAPNKQYLSGGIASFKATREDGVR